MYHYINVLIKEYKKRGINKGRLADRLGIPYNILDLLSTPTYKPTPTVSLKVGNAVNELFSNFLQSEV